MRFLFLCLLQLVALKGQHLDIENLVKKLARPFGLERTIRTLIKLESQDGKYVINLQSKDCGITQINIKTFMARHKIPYSTFNENKACQDLINSPKLAVANAIEELLFWRQVHCGGKYCTNAQYQKMIKSYNAGYNYNSPQAKTYWLKFKKTYNDLYGGTK